MNTPEEAAASLNKPAVQEWLSNPERTPRDILRFLRAVPAEGHSAHFARTALSVRISEEQEKSAQKVERQTKHLIWLTWAIVLLTVGLLFYTVMLYENEKKHSPDTQDIQSQERR